jgi:hypothetical protein
MSSLALLEDFRLASDVSGFARNYDCSFDRITHLRKLTLTSSDALSLGGLCHSASHMVGNNPHLLLFISQQIVIGTIRPCMASLTSSTVSYSPSGLLNSAYFGTACD